MRLTEIKEKETIEYLKGILDGNGLINNPMRINIPRVGEGVATSTLLHRPHNGKIESYFKFRQGEERSEFYIRDGKCCQELLEVIK